MDYAFFRDEEGGESLPTIVLNERHSKALSAHVVPYKGADFEWTVHQCVQDMRKWGLRGRSHHQIGPGGRSGGPGD